MEPPWPPSNSASANWRGAKDRATQALVDSNTLGCAYWSWRVCSRCGPLIEGSAIRPEPTVPVASARSPRARLGSVCPRHSVAPGLVKLRNRGRH